ncbi:hypothetical protein SLEP1_g48809 [Rubroshorea leprosula]|uniref:RNase H type-1 domain-containing protein n=1 Tax=Rubroshorea leprosula TaxID=152421 RepID=A0AAV5LWR0_9ROSI|nr:hypothetical protein SLEP1_g48809 [Rubroshorea leprosula]
MIEHLYTWHFREVEEKLDHVPLSLRAKGRAKEKYTGASVSVRGDGKEEEENRLQVEMEEWLLREEIMWRQYFREIWLQDGDKNSKFLHGKALRRHERNVEQKLLSSDGVWRMDAREEGYGGAYVGLLALFTGEEVRKALFQMHPSKALGPDGMSPSFFQKYWDKLERIMNRYWWGKGEDQLKIHWTEWRRLANSKEDEGGGLGVRSMHQFNLAMLGKGYRPSFTWCGIWEARKDGWVWQFTKNGGYMAKSGYYVACSMADDTVDRPSSLEGQFRVRFLWKLQMPKKKRSLYFTILKIVWWQERCGWEAKWAYVFLSFKLQVLENFFEVMENRFHRSNCSFSIICAGYYGIIGMKWCGVSKQQRTFGIRVIIRDKSENVMVVLQARRHGYLSPKAVEASSLQMGLVWAYELGFNRLVVKCNSSNVVAAMGKVSADL